ncbi:RdRP-domain-containing protein [Artomyces pyxidatus]|uniref:RdRP-domain-containing protein n=1 Tax=Artomyces pyxidatus TaxID=48021 RepID=A0ACB8T6P0_9AGAM|nr:RdRP-domain-containing protein [Artomyces pyxidatus]
MSSRGKFVLRERPQVDDESWNFSGVPASFLDAPPPPPNSNVRPKGKLITFTPEGITLELQPLPSNRITLHEDPPKLIIASFARFRFPDVKPSVSTDYMIRLFKAGLFLNGVQYRYYGHGNSQMRGRGCYLRQANTDGELDQLIYAMGDLEKIMNVAKRAKRIGLLFSGAELDYVLDPKYVGDIDDLMTGDENFSDGCGLISRRLSMQISRSKRVIFRNRPYTPCVIQIRYRGYKGVLMLHPALDEEKIHLVEFRKSMKKFNATADNIFSVVDYSKPYSFGRLNSDIVVLLSSLGVTNEALLAKQTEYFQWIQDASQDVVKGFEFMSSLGKHVWAEKLLLDGIDSPAVQREIRASQKAELAAFRKNDDLKKERVRMLIHKSRRLFGVCDPYRILREGEVHVRITVSRTGVSAIHGLDVIVVRNPCLHPGDILKLRAVYNPKLAHLVDCVVFPSMGRRAAPAMSSGGDLDGDEYFVCWDPVLVPRNISESYGYPPNKEPTPPTKITRQDLARHFATYNGSGMAQTAALHSKWVRVAPEGALSTQCQELNALYSQAVDGARITIPERLRNPPPPPDGSQFILDELFAHARRFSAQFLETEGNAESSDLPRETAQELIVRLLSVQEATVSEFTLVNLAHNVARKHGIDFSPYLTHINYGALLTHEKYALAATFADLASAFQPSFMWNSLMRSDILTAKDLNDKKLGGPIRVQRLYSSKNLGLSAFFEYLARAMQDYTRRLLIFKLFNLQRSNTFIHLRKPPINSGEEIITSIALQQISARVQRQMGRVNRTPVVAVEIHVVSNRDREAHQLFDMRFEHVYTEEYIKRNAHQVTTFQLNMLKNADLDALPEAQRIVFREAEAVVRAHLASSVISFRDIDDCAEFAWKYRADDRLFWIFDVIIKLHLDSSLVSKWLDREPLLVYSLLKAYVPSEDGALGDEIADIGFQIVQHIIRSANAVPIASLVALEKIRTTIASLDIEQYLEILELVTLSIRALPHVQEVLFVLHECREPVRSQSAAMEYAHKHALSVACDRAEEAGDECPCDEQGRLKRQRKAPALVPLIPVEDKPSEVIAHIRVDNPSTTRLHSHVRLRAASKPEKGHLDYLVVDGVVVQAQVGEVRISLVHTLPPEYTQIQWYLYDAGSIATFKAMMEAIRRLAVDGGKSCRFHRMITSPGAENSPMHEHELLEDDGSSHVQEDGDLQIENDLSANLNDSQRQAVITTPSSQVSLIWGPPAVDNVLERFARTNREEGLLATEKILRFATDRGKVSKALQSFTIESRVGGEIVRDSKRREKADKIVKAAVIIFTTCAGAGLGNLRCKKAVLVGDHVQLRPMVRSLGQALQHDVSLFERLYTRQGAVTSLARTMLDVQYRFPEALARFPSAEFYDGRLQTGVSNATELLRGLLRSQFPWPQHAGNVLPAVFVPCRSEEDQGGMSKSNEGQARLVKHIVQLLSTDRASDRTLDNPPLITVLSPYTKQRKLLHDTLPSTTPSFTIDSFQGRESDIIIYSTVRSNASDDIGFLEDARRLNVVWTRAKLALIVVGNRKTMTSGGGLWSRAIGSCSEVAIPGEWDNLTVDI